MPIYMDRHEVPGATATDVAHAHQEDLKIQDAYDCRAITYWFDEQRGTAFCLVEAPNKDAVKAMHDNAHGLIPHEILEVKSNVVEAFLGRISDPGPDASGANAVIQESAFRAILCIDLHCTAADGVQSGLMPEYAPDIRKTVSENIQRYGGRPVEPVHGCTMASYPTVFGAFDSARKIQEEIREQHPGNGNRPGCVSMALTAGMPVGEGSRLFGGAITEASRLCEITGQGHIAIAPAAAAILRDRLTGIADTTGCASISPPDAAFLQSLMEFVERDYTNPKFRLSECIRELGVSTSQLYRKVSSLSGLSPVGFLRRYRLRRAVEYLESGAGGISEAAFESGFTSPSYFSKCFRMEYGISPSSYAGKLGT